MLNEKSGLVDAKPEHLDPDSLNVRLNRRQGIRRDFQCSRGTGNKEYWSRWMEDERGNRGTDRGSRGGRG